MNLTEEIHARLQSLQPSHLEIRDDSALHAGHAGNNGGGHFQLTMVSPAFTGKPTLARHRLVYQLLADLMPHRIHALSMQVYASDEAFKH
ncbi:BolA family protein [Methylobacillus flagellatus]|uniref:BolA family protein n=1 Tax=Methylobacillus flagellatus TaxID=405 RepID=UPI0010F789C9|nr:BolA family protein [Methylobacillus flagellatus]